MSVTKGAMQAAAKVMNRHETYHTMTEQQVYEDIAAIIDAETYGEETVIVLKRIILYDAHFAARGSWNELIAEARAVLAKLE